MFFCLKNMNPLSDGTVALGDLHISNPGPGLFDPTAQMVIAVGICLCFILAGAGLVIWALRRDRGK